MSLRRWIFLYPGSNGQDLSPHPSRQVPSHVIISVAATAAASIFLALIYYAVFRHSSRRRRPLAHLTHTSSSSSSSSSSSDHDDHPIWHVQTVGLDDAAITSIGSYAHRFPAGGGDRTANCSCSVCLGELLDGDTVRLLPKCGHVFHVQCIDTWLRCHVSCPLCRAAAVDPCPAPGPTTSDDADVEARSAESNPTQLDGDGGGQEGEGESEARVRVAVEIPESSGALRLRSILMDLEKEQGGMESDKGQNESGRVSCSRDWGGRGAAQFSHCDLGKDCTFLPFTQSTVSRG